MGTARDLAELYFAATERGDVEEALATFAPDAEFLGPMGRLPFPEGVRAYLSGYAGSFPDARFEIQHVIESGDEVVMEGEWVGTHTGPLTFPDGTTLPPTGKAVRAPFGILFRIRDGKLVSHRGYWDLAGFLTQLGVGQG